MLRTVTRRVETVRRTEDIGSVLTAVADDARLGRPQPVAVEIPIDLQYATAAVERARAARGRPRRRRRRRPGPGGRAAGRRPSAPSSGPVAA